MVWGTASTWDQDGNCLQKWMPSTNCSAGHRGSRQKVVTVAGDSFWSELVEVVKSGTGVG